MAKREILGSRVLVTGASSGIGCEIAKELAREGADLVLVARREERLKKLADSIREDAGRRVELVVGDLTEAATRQRAIEASLASLGGLDVLINNAGVGAVGLFENSSEDSVRRIIDLNFVALVEMTRSALPLLKSGTNPIVVNIGSVLGHRAVPYRAVYSASKFAVNGFTESIRAEFAAYQIDVLLVTPGATATEFAESVLERTGENSWVEPKPVPADLVAQKTVAAIRRGKREIIPYGFGKLLILLNRLSPRLVDYFMARSV